MEITVRAKPGKDVRGIMTDLPFGAVKVQVENGYAQFIGACGEVLGTRVMGQPRLWRCTACGCRCEAGSLTDRIPECYKHDPRADFSPVIRGEEEDA